jgi:superfamily II DNA or RNA helicase
MFKFKNPVPSNLRSHQELAYRIARNGMSSKQDGILVSIAAAGSGKTFQAALVARGALESGIVERVLYLAPRVSLIRQTVAVMDSVLAPYPFRKADGGSTPYAKPWNTTPEIGFACSYAGLDPKKEELFVEYVTERPTLIIADEFHHLGYDARSGDFPKGQSRVMHNVVGQALENGGRVLAMSGTPASHDPYTRPMFLQYTEDGTPQGDIVLTPKQAWKSGYTLRCDEGDPERNQINLIQADGTGTYGREGDSVFIDTLAEPVVRTGVVSRNRDLQKYTIDQCLREWSAYRRQYPQSQCILALPNIDDAKHWYKELGRHNACLAVSDENSSKGDIHAFQDGKYDVLISVGMAYEGLDAPNATHGAFLRGYDSEPYFIQFVNRFTRLGFEGKEAYIYYPNTPRQRDLAERFKKGSMGGNLLPVPRESEAGGGGDGGGLRGLEELRDFQGANDNGLDEETLRERLSVISALGAYLPAGVPYEVLLAAYQENGGDEAFAEAKGPQLDPDLYPDVSPSDIRKALCQNITRIVNKDIASVLADRCGPRTGDKRSWPTLVNTALKCAPFGFPGRQACSHDHLRAIIKILKEHPQEVMQKAIDLSRKDAR